MYYEINSYFVIRLYFEYFISGRVLLACMFCCACMFIKYGNDLLLFHCRVIREQPHFMFFFFNKKLHLTQCSALARAV